MKPLDRNTYPEAFVVRIQIGRWVLQIGIGWLVLAWVLALVYGIRTCHG